LGVESKPNKEKNNVQEKESVTNSESHVSDSHVSVKDSNIEDREKEKEKNDKVVKLKEEPLDVALLKPLKIMHRIINQNIYSQKQIIFKN